MDLPTNEQIGQLTKHRSPFSVSLLMPTHRAGREQQQDIIRFKNLLKQARSRLLEAGATRATVDEILRPAVNLRYAEDFWRHCQDGLACYCAPGFFQIHRVPLSLKETVVVNQRFHIRPLLPILINRRQVYLLALTQEDYRLFVANKYSISEIDVPYIPVHKSRSNDTRLHYHAHRAPSQGVGQTEAAVYHGHQDSAERAKQDALQFFREVDQVVNRFLQGKKVPLMLACVGYLAALYESVNSYQHLVRAKIPGNPERWNDDELREHACQLLETYFREERQESWSRLQQSLSQARGSKDVTEIASAAEEGRIDTLFLVKDEQCWGPIDGRFSNEPDNQEPHDTEEELLDYATAKTLCSGGQVYLADELPGLDAPIAAAFRY